MRGLWPKADIPIPTSTTGTGDGPRKTPQPIAEAVYKAVSAAVADPGVREKLLASGTISAPDAPDALGKLLTTEFNRWGKVIRDKGPNEP